MRLRSFDSKSRHTSHQLRTPAGLEAAAFPSVLRLLPIWPSQGGVVIELRDGDKKHMTLLSLLSP